MTPVESGCSIADAAELLGLSAHTLRYYERIGLVDVARDDAGRRRYRDDDIRRLVFITRLRASDLPIGQIQRYFELVAEGPHTEPERLALLERHREDVRERLRQLQDALATIDFKITTYGGTLPACAAPKET